LFHVCNVDLHKRALRVGPALAQLTLVVVPDSVPKAVRLDEEVRLEKLHVLHSHSVGS
jgi:hypothetical protein